MQSIEKKQTGSLVTRNVADLVKKEHFVLDSEYLVTMLVVVPLASINDWNNRYEKLTDMIVPRSSQLIYQVQEHKATRAVNELSRSFTLLLAFSESRIYQDLRHNARQALSKRKQKALVGIGAISGHCETARSFVDSSTNSLSPVTINCSSSPHLLSRTTTTPSSPSHASRKWPMNSNKEPEKTNLLFATLLTMKSS